jgi:hypothetical protein
MMRGLLVSVAGTFAVLRGAVTQGEGAGDGVDDVQCNMDYTTAYMATMEGHQCDPDTLFGTCDPACQAVLDQVFKSCPSSLFVRTDPITGLNVTSNFIWRAVRTLSARGPSDCNYHKGYSGCAPECSMATITGGAGVSDYERHHCIDVDPDSGQSGPEAVWHSCEGVCRTQFEAFNAACRPCDDPEGAHPVACDENQCPASLKHVGPTHSGGFPNRRRQKDRPLWHGQRPGVWPDVGRSGLRLLRGRHLQYHSEQNAGHVPVPSGDTHPLPFTCSIS